MIPNRSRATQSHSFTQVETPEGVTLTTAAFPDKSWSGADLAEAMHAARQDIGTTKNPTPTPPWEAEWGASRTV